ncbi:MAG TPA: neutral/alkaline non-lysosomal ceramidase N-terminal domain-containing protein [Terriglobia bacterium]|nr:neutral/alkaline non-lysosomal ceramidase N-terminal domain-containing protein [Terriglobia bacterium]
MRNLFCFRTWSCLVMLIGAAALASPGAQPGTLSVGAARVDITPPANAALPMSGYEGRGPFRSIHDPIYARAIVLSDGTHNAAILAWELIEMPDGVWRDLSQRISTKLGIPADNLILAGEHVHSAPMPAGAYYKGSPATLAYTAKLEDEAFEAVRQAKANLQPAQFGFGTGKCYVNINRREFFPKEGGWWLGYNPNGPSDKTVSVLKFETLSGRPIAIFINYSVHGTVMGPHNLEVSGDLPGATSRYVERFYEGKIDQDRSDAGWELQLQSQEKAGPNGVVALWTSGPAGDQNPVVSDSGEDFSMVDALGRILGEESVRVAQGITTLSSRANIRGAQQVIACPGRRLESGPHGPAPRSHYKFMDTKPENIRLSLLMLNNVALTGVSGEVLTPIFQRLQKESPFAETIMITHANGLSGYIPDDAAYNQVSYEVAVTHFKPGCAEAGIVNGLVALMKDR